MKKTLLFLFFILMGTLSFSENLQENEYEIIIKRFNTLNNYAVNDEKISQLLNNLNSKKEKTYLWSEYPNMKNGPDILFTYRNITELAKGYSNSNSKYYKNKKLKNTILNSLNWMKNNAYKENFPELGNWWQWEIGIPKDLNKIIAFMYEDLTPKERLSFLKGSQYFQPYANWSGYSPSAKFSSNPEKRVSTGGNRIDTSLIVFMRGILLNNSEEVQEALKSIPDVGDFVTTGDGFYKDGSFIQHESIPYGGTYGAVLLGGLGIIQNLVANTSLEIKDPRFNNIYDSIINGYNYLLIDGRISDSISGRAVTRPNTNDMTRGEENLIAIAMISQGAPKEYKYKLQEIVKRNIEKNNLVYLPAKIKNPVEKEVIESILKNDDILTHELIGSKNFGNMDRFVNRNKNYSFILSMHSSRIGNFESILGENLKGWHSSDGMYYIYTQKQNEYFEYWPTVNPYRLPGTTESLTTRKDVSGQRRVKKYMVQKDFVGGACDGFNSMIGMDFSSWNDKTTGKKSWFILDNKIIALGSDINSTDGVVNTTIENKIIDSKEDIIQNTEDTLIIKNDKSNLYSGYFILDKNKLNNILDERIGSWKEAGGKGPNKKIFKKYITSYINHGENPKNNSYEYIIIPEVNENILNNFNKNSIHILSNNKFAQGVEFKNIFGINFFEGSDKKVKNFIGKTPLSLIGHFNGNNLNLFISDPTHKNQEGIILEIIGSYSLENKISNVNINYEKDKTILTIKNLKNGESIKVSLVKNKK
ncbi:polysaccharide lyase 8 family protein [Cetobacterium ceti]